jgi:hypothetical protein
LVNWHFCIRLVDLTTLTPRCDPSPTLPTSRVSLDFCGWYVIWPITIWPIDIWPIGISVLVEQTTLTSRSDPSPNLYTNCVFLDFCRWYAIWPTDTWPNVSACSEAYETFLKIFLPFWTFKNQKQSYLEVFSLSRTLRWRHDL